MYKTPLTDHATEKLGYLLSQVENLRVDIQEAITTQREMMIRLDERLIIVEAELARTKTVVSTIKWLGIAVTTIVAFTWEHFRDLLRMVIR